MKNFFNKISILWHKLKFEENWLKFEEKIGFLLTIKLVYVLIIIGMIYLCAPEPYSHYALWCCWRIILAVLLYELITLLLQRRCTNYK